MPSNLNPPHTQANIFAIWLDEIDHNFKIFLWVGAIELLWSFWLRRNDAVFNGRILFPLLVITGVHVSTSIGEQRHIYRDLYALLEATVRNLLPHMDGSVVYGSALHRLSRFYESFMYLFCANFFILFLLFGCVHPKNAEAMHEL